MAEVIIKMSRFSEWQDARKKHGLFNRINLNSSTDKKIEKLREGFSYEKEEDVVDRIFSNPENLFAKGLTLGRRLSNEKLKNMLIKKTPGPETMGYLVEYLFRENIDPEIVDKYKNINIEDYAKYVKQRAASASSAESAAAIANIAAFGFGMGASAVLTKLVKDDDNIDSFVDFIKTKNKMSTKVQPINHAVFSSFSPTENIVRTGKDLAIAGHELGHAKNYMTMQKLFGKAAPAVSKITYQGLESIPFGRKFGPVARIPFLGLLAVPFAARNITNSLKGDDPSSVRNKTIGYVENHPIQLGLAAVSPKLIEEGTASVRSLANLAQHRGVLTALKASPKLLAAFATYAAAAAVPIAGINYINKRTDVTQDVKDYIKKRL